jgi:hypothetical protein
MSEALPVFPDTSSDEGPNFAELNMVLLGMDENALMSKDLEDKSLENLS